jgi:hypothetical protein
VTVSPQALRPVGVGLDSIGRAWLVPEESTNAGPGVTYRLAVGVVNWAEAFARGAFESVDPAMFQRLDPTLALIVGSQGTASATPIVARVGAGTANWGRVSPADLVAEIRANLALNLSQTALVLGVERPTVYAWLADRARPQPANWTRLMDVADVASFWRRLSASPIESSALLSRLRGQTLLELLSRRPLPSAEIFERLGMLAEHAVGSVTQPRRVPSVLESAARFGIAATGRRGNHQEIAWLTRQPFSADDEEKR